MLKKMRRFKQQLDFETCKAILKRQKQGVLSLIDQDGDPYAVPINYLYYQDKIYFHSAKQGHKIEALKLHPKASFCVIDKDEIVPEKLTTYFRSVICLGHIYPIENQEAIIKPFSRAFNPTISDEDIDKEFKQFQSQLMILEMTIDQISGKEAIELVNGK